MSKIAKCCHYLSDGDIVDVIEHNVIRIIKTFINKEKAKVCLNFYFDKNHVGDQRYYGYNIIPPILQYITRPGKPTICFNHSTPVSEKLIYRFDILKHAEGVPFTIVIGPEFDPGYLYFNSNYMTESKLYRYENSIPYQAEYNKFKTLRSQVTVVRTKISRWG